MKIDLTREYRTRNGNKVTLDSIPFSPIDKSKNPVARGSIEGYTGYTTWDLDTGKYCPPIEYSLDLIAIEED